MNRMLVVVFGEANKAFDGRHLEKSRSRWKYLGLRLCGN
jgi:hypothetical protein